MWKNESNWPIGFLFIKPQVKFLIQPSASEKTPKLNIQYTVNKIEDLNIGLYTYFVLWLSPHNIPKSSIMYWQHNKLYKLKTYAGI